MTGCAPGAAAHWIGVVAAAVSGVERQRVRESVGAVRELHGHVAVLGGRTHDVLGALERARLGLAAVSAVLAVRRRVVDRRGVGLRGSSGRVPTR